MQDKILLNEKKRIEELQSFDILDTLAEQAYDDIVRLASEICETPMAMVNLVDSERQWTKSSVGIEVGEALRIHAFCSHTILQPDEIFSVENAAEDGKFADNPFVVGEPYIRFYAGAPLVTESGEAVGALCVIDREPRRLTEKQKLSLRVLARQIIAQMELRRTIRQMREAEAKQRDAQRALRESEARFQAFMSHTPAVAYMKDEAGRLVYLNKGFETRFNLEAKKMVGKTDFDFLSAEAAAAIRKNDEMVLSEWKSLEIEENVPSPDGSATDWLSLKFPFLGTDKEKFVGGVSIDITARKLAEKKLNESEQRYRNLFELSPGYITIHDLNGVITEVNEAAADALGYRCEEMIGRNLADFLLPELRPRLVEYLRRIQLSILDEGSFQVLMKSGERRIWQYRNRLQKEAGGANYVIGCAQDITELKETQDKLHDLTLTDDLTELHNRRGFFTLAEQALRFARRAGKTCIAIYADVDDLKLVNDKFGHDAGSQMIVDAARIFKSFFRDSDIAARLGGDEFVILVQDISEKGEEIIKARLQKGIEEFNKEASRPMPLSISYGIARFDPKSEKTIKELVSEADRLMYLQKQTKKTPLNKRFGSIEKTEDFDV